MQKSYKILIGFLLIFILIPSIILYMLWNSNFSIVEYISFYQLFISPLLFFIAYWLAKLKTAKERIIFVLFGFIIPFGLIYTLAYLDYLKNFNPGF